MTSSTIHRTDLTPQLKRDILGGVAAQLIVLGASTSTGEQLLAAVETDDPNLKIAPAFQFLALTASQTGLIDLCGATIHRDRVVAGPIPNVLTNGGRSGAGSLTTSALALGTARSTLRALQAELRQSTNSEQIVVPLTDEGRALEQALSAASRREPRAWSAEQLRLRANSYVTRLAQSYLAVAKGTGFASGHPAERAVREAMFFYVWSCPQAVVQGNLQELACHDAAW